MCTTVWQQTVMLQCTCGIKSTGTASISCMLRHSTATCWWQQHECMYVDITVVWHKSGTVTVCVTLQCNWLRNSSSAQSPFGYVWEQQVSHYGETGHELETSFALHTAQDRVRNEFTSNKDRQDLILLLSHHSSHSLHHNWGSNILWDTLFCSLLTEFHVLCYHNHFHLVINNKLSLPKVSFNTGHRWKSLSNELTQYKIVGS